MRTLTPLVLLLAACPPKAPVEDANGEDEMDAVAFVDQADARLRKVWVARDEAAWAYGSNITPETEAAASAAEEAAMAELTALIDGSTAYRGAESIDPATARQLHVLRMATPLAAPSDAAKRARLAAIATQMSGMYGKGEYCKDDVCRDLGELEDVLTHSRDWDAQLDAWLGWRTISPPLRPLYTEFVALGNEGAKEVGFADMGQMWRSTYDMAPEAVPVEADRLFEQVKPLYEQLHCYVRAELAEEYGEDKVAPDGPIPAHLLGNMWAQEWANLYPLVEPYPEASSPDVTKALADAGYDEIKMVEQAEAFFVSLGLDPLPETFWERSIFVQPEDRDMVCHASAWDVQWNGDVRIKMCIDIDAEDFRVIHHELGHDYYFMYYKDQPMLFQNGAHDGFHEAVGDAIALSMTPAYLQEIGLIAEASASDEAVINGQMRAALDKVAFLPFGRMIDQWRWDVFDGTTTADTYNADWWALREKYQGVAAPVERTEADFDPGAKYHIPGNTPYLRYFFAHVLMFQFHEALCEAAGHEGPLHTCSIYGSEPAGAKLQAMLELGASEPWPVALEAIAGTSEMSAEPLLEYFSPLQSWLEQQNDGRTCGW